MATVSDNISEMQFDRNTQILKIKVLENAEVTFQNALKHIVNRSKICEQNYYVALIDAENYFTVNQDVLKYISKFYSNKYCLANAFYNVNLANKITIHFYNKIFQPNQPIHILKSYEDTLKFANNVLKIKTSR